MLKDHHIRIQSDNSIAINARNSGGDFHNHLFISNSAIQMVANQLVVRGTDGKLLFLVGENEVGKSDVVIATDKLRINSKLSANRIMKK